MKTQRFSTPHAHAGAGSPSGSLSPASVALSYGPPLSFGLVLRIPLLSGQLRASSETTGRTLASPGLQLRLREIDGILSGYPGYGGGASCTIKDIHYRAIFAGGWRMEADVTLVLGWRTRQRKSAPDPDNLFVKMQNALAFPSNGLCVPGVAPGTHLLTLVENDRQFQGLRLRMVPDPAVDSGGELALLHVTACPPPSLALVIPR